MFYGNNTLCQLLNNLIGGPEDGPLTTITYEGITIAPLSEAPINLNNDNKTLTMTDNNKNIINPFYLKVSVNYDDYNIRDDLNTLISVNFTYHHRKIVELLSDILPNINGYIELINIEIDNNNFILESIVISQIN